MIGVHHNIRNWVTVLGRLGTTALCSMNDWFHFLIPIHFSVCFPNNISFTTHITN